MTEHEAPVRILSQEECWQLLRTSRLGRLAASLNNQPEIFPVNFVVDGNGLVIRTAEGSKLVMVTINDSVAFEVDTCDANGAVSVVARGPFGREPLLVQVGFTRFALRHSEAGRIRIRPGVEA